MRAQFCFVAVDGLWWSAAFTRVGDEVPMVHIARIDCYHPAKCLFASGVISWASCQRHTRGMFVAAGSDPDGFSYCCRWRWCSFFVRISIMLGVGHRFRFGTSLLHRLGATAVRKVG